ncbi:hypothetical protein FOC4_g10008110 [Fusarium odoratissimum]|uniref:Uncharacterized protein n=3 Tax=Fusarium oxysporum species complex TaxID=171631 RepID=N1RPG2_FUSC4|nr:uncharacterized protein FOIG_04210 [Fusarium odoratissimum NRRL 54006]EMT65992.1 hypothetical protein FOC4_g10008110 [Fusarium odoratissimum]EXM05703.1 hypothetical protein FOIG_04210 [Fusarium odoratissimum NRRL 54006]TXC00255.1 hypothetical protein FocTR4_00014222 [Fusarium oxysporum f. sp. cubense]
MSLISLVPFSFRSRHAPAIQVRFPREFAGQDPCCNSHIPLHLLRPERMCSTYWDMDLGSGRASTNACTGINTSANAETTLVLDAKVMDQAHHTLSVQVQALLPRKPQG